MFSTYLVAALCVAVSALPQSQPFEHLYNKRQALAVNSSLLQVDLGYSVYQGVANTTSSINSWLGIRFAAPPTGSNRWQPPKAPAVNRSAVINANHYGSQCPQTSLSGPNRPSILASEDCLFLNVYSPAGAKDLPVLIYIHGGGYGLGNASNTDPSAMIATSLSLPSPGFVAMVIQYRLGAFGFLSSDEVFRNGVVNAGLLDQQFAIQWAQSYISLFGGDPKQITIAGESAGAGSVMLQAMAYGGSLGESLFQSGIAASPYLPQQYGYKDWQPSQAYYAFAHWAGCLPNQAYGGSNQTIFQCLVEANTTTLQYASFNVSMSGKYGTWGFLPVTDGIFVQEEPSLQLLQKRVNGKNILVGNNANEAPQFTKPNITTENDLLSWLTVTFPLFTNDDIAKVLMYYPSTNASINPNDATFATLGYTGPSAINVSSFATGQQQRADNIYAESTFVCPSYWLTEAYSGKGRTAYHYQYSVPAAPHASDLTSYFGPPKINQGPDLNRAFMAIWGNFVRLSNPSISTLIANGANSTTPMAANPATDWPQYHAYAPYMMNLNETGGTPYTAVGLLNGVPGNATQYMGPGLMNNFTLVNAYTWEAGRGYRCDFWRSVAGITPA